MTYHDLYGGYGGGFFPFNGYGTFNNLMSQWAQYGLFTVLLPFLLIFSVVFAILEKVNLLRNRGVHLIVALVVSFMSITNPFISHFFILLFSNLALGIVILLVLLILVGLAIGPETQKGGVFNWILGIGAIVIFLVVLGRSGTLSTLFGNSFYSWLSQNAGMTFIFLILIAAIIFIYKSVKDEPGITGRGLGQGEKIWAFERPGQKPG